MENFIVSTKGLENWKPHEGDGPAALLAMEGEYKVLIKKATPGTASTGNKLINCVLQILDEDADPRGAILYRSTVVSGTDKNGDDMNRSIGDLLYSAGRPKEKVTALGAQGVIDLQLVCTGITTQGLNIAHVTVTTEEYQGRERSVCNWIRPERYAEAKAANTHRRARHAVASQPRQPAAPQTSNGAGAGAGAAAGAGQASAGAVVSNI